MAVIVHKMTLILPIDMFSSYDAEQITKAEKCAVNNFVFVSSKGQ